MSYQSNTQPNFTSKKFRKHSFQIFPLQQKKTRLFPDSEVSPVGPQTDLHWVTVDAVRTAAMDSSSEAWRFQAAEVSLASFNG